jgi:hypothetical protein
MEKGMRCVPETTERLSVSGFTVVWLIKAGEPKEQRRTTAPQSLYLIESSSVAACDERHRAPVSKPKGCDSTTRETTTRPEAQRRRRPASPAV